MKSPHEQRTDGAISRDRKAYSKPQLRFYGDLEILTGGSSTGAMGDGGMSPNNKT
jgi:hypothetical protein